MKQELVGSNSLPWVYCGEFAVGSKVCVVKSIKVRQNKDRFVDIFKKTTDESYFWREITPADVLTVNTVPESEYETGGGVHSSFYPGSYSVITEDGAILIGIPTTLLQKASH